LPTSGPKPALDVEATAVVRQALATLEEARAAAARLELLAREGLAPQAELDTARASLLRAEAALQSAREEVRIREAQVRQRESELRIARQRLTDTTIRSPIDGLVQARQASAGEFLAAGAPIAQIVRIDPLRLRLALPEREASSVRQGQTVYLSSSTAEAAEGDPGHSGVVARLAPSLDTQSRSLLIEADIPNTGQLRPGNFVHARIVVGSRTVATVPESAIVTFAGLQKVITVQDGKAVERPVRTGATQEQRVEILSGLEPGEAVVKTPGSLQQGQAVSVLGEP
jgi:RND family efflux transporter MFP subunit